VKDEGAGADANAGDGVWTRDPGLASGAGVDDAMALRGAMQGIANQEPAYRAPPIPHQYFDTVPRIPTFERPCRSCTVHRQHAGRGHAGSRGAVYYQGEFYDNVLFTLHGQSSSGFPKKSYNVDFNRAQRFLWSTNAPRVADIDLLTNWADKSKVRHVLAYEVMRESGVAAHFAHNDPSSTERELFQQADSGGDADES